MESKERYTVNELAVVPADELRWLGSVLARSGYFEDAKDDAKAIVKILTGRELGIGPIASMTGIHIIQGKPAIGATLMAALVKKSGKYDYRVVELDDEKAVVEFFEHGKPIGRSTFTIADAKRQGTQNLAKFPRNMLLARAISNGVRWHCPDLFIGPVYEPGELGEEVDYDNDTVIVQAADVHEVQEQPVAVPQKQRATEKQTTQPGQRPWGPDELRSALNTTAGAYRKRAEKYLGPPPERVLIETLNALASICGGPSAAEAFVEFVTGDSDLDKLDFAMAQAVSDWLHGKAGEDIVKVEASLVLNSKKENGNNGKL